MRRACAALAFALSVFACHVERAPSGRPPGSASAADTLAQLEQDSVAGEQVHAVVRSYYARLTARDWPAVRESFWPGATITVRTAAPGRGASRAELLTVDEFLRRVQSGRDRRPPGVLLEHEHISAYDELAAVWVIWRAQAQRARGASRGLDAFHLVRRGGEWRIVSVLSARETPEHPLFSPQR